MTTKYYIIIINRIAQFLLTTEIILLCIIENVQKVTVKQV